LGKKKDHDAGAGNNYKEVLIDNDIDWEEERHTEDLILNADVVMKVLGFR
jgi:UDP-N-acetylmuramoylalanine--D-glutamate ligase